MDTKARAKTYQFSLLSPEYLLYKLLNRNLRDSILKYAKGRVLDIGCGNKPFKAEFNAVSSEYIGADIEQSSDQQVDVICSAIDLPFEDNSFDTVFTTQVLEHVSDHQTMLNEAFRVLKPGGYIILSAPMIWYHHEVPYDFFRFTRYGMEYIFGKAGFKTETILSNGGKWAAVGQLLINNFRLSLENAKSPLKKLAYLLYRVSLLKLWINLLFGWLDRRDKDAGEVLTLNHIVIAQKPR